MKFRQPAPVTATEQRCPVERGKGDVLARAYTIPFNPDARKLQEIYRELMETLRELGKRAEAGEEEARCWLERFMNLGEQLGNPMLETDEEAAQPGSEQVIPGLSLKVSPESVPSATYRLQFNAGFTFRDAHDLVPYLHALGISDCYASPVLQARAGSSHGYDICDHGQLNQELGGEKDFDAFSDALRQHGKGLILDMVPNLMGIADSDNSWWMNVQENGAGSVNSRYSDIDWHPVNPALENEVLLP